MALLALLETTRQGTRPYLEKLQQELDKDPGYMGSHMVFRPDILPDEEGEGFYDLVIYYELVDALNDDMAAKLPHGWKLALIPKNIKHLCGLDPDKSDNYSAIVETTESHDLHDRKESQVTHAGGFQAMVEPPSDRTPEIGSSPQVSVDDGEAGERPEDDRRG